MGIIDERSYLGKGWSFPPVFNKLAKQVSMVTNKLDIEQSLEILLSTRPGERAMQPAYGCNLDIMLFEPVTATASTYVKDLVKKAILFYEARIDVLEIQIDDSRLNEGIILIEIDYMIRTTNSRFNFVYPFYLDEGAKILQGV